MARRHYSKNDVKKHYSGCGYGPSLPAVNVKVYSMWHLTAKIQEEFKCSLEVADKALNYAFESAQEAFWEYWQDKSGDLENGLHGSPEYAYFPGYDVTVNCGGRSGGWLEVEGLPDIDDWDAVMLGRWRRFEIAVLGDVAYRTGWESIRDDIGANSWAEDKAERYNYMDTPAGVRKVSDLNNALDAVKDAFRKGEPEVIIRFEPLP